MHLPLQGRLRGLEVKEGGRVAAARKRAEAVVAIANDSGRTLATQSGQLASLRQKHGEKDEERRGQEAVGQPGLSIVLAAGSERTDPAGDPNRQRETNRQTDESRLPIIVPDTSCSYSQASYCHQECSGIPGIEQQLWKGRISFN